MSVFDSLKKQAADAIGARLGGDAAEAAVHPGLFAGVVEMIQAHGVAAIVEKLKKGGLSETVASWVGTGVNLSISAEQLRSALGPETIEALAQKAGLPPGEASALLAKLLPGVVDRLTPNGRVEEPPVATDAAETPSPALETGTEHVDQQPEATEG